MQQPYPACFKYLRRGKKARVRDYPPGDPFIDDQDPTRVLYRLPAQEDIEVQGKLILGDWVIDQWKGDESKKDQAIENIVYYMEDDFVIYGWRDSVIVPLRNRQEAELFIENEYQRSLDRKPCLPRDIITQAGKQKLRLIKDEIFLLTQEALAKKYTTSKTILVLSDSRQICFDDNGELNNDVDDMQLVGGIYLSYFDSVNIGLNFTFENFPRLKKLHIIHTNVKEINFELLNEQENSLIFPPIEEFEYEITEKTPGSYYNRAFIYLWIEKICASLRSFKLKNIEISVRFPAMPFLKICVLESVSMIDLALRSIGSGSPNLKKLVLNNVQIDNMKYGYIRNKSFINVPHVVLINIKPKILDYVMQYIFNQDQVKELTIENSRIERVQIRHFKNLNKLKIYNCDIQDNIEISNTLEIIDFRNSTIKINNLFLLINNIEESGNVKTLDLTSCVWNTSGEKLTEKAIDLLESIKTCHSPVDVWYLIGIVNTISDEIKLKNKALTDASPINKILSKPEYDPSINQYIGFSKDSKEFIYEGKNKTKNQDMFIEKFSQYLMIEQKFLEWIPNLKNGMCAPLADIFYDLELDEWEDFSDLIFKWDGKKDNLNNQLEENFEKILAYYKNYYIDQKRDKRNLFIGEAAEEWFEQEIKKNKLLKLKIINPWHRIAIKFIPKENLYAVYDPEFEEGYIKVPQEKLFTVIKKSLGKLIFMLTDFSEINSVPKNAFNNAQKFIRDGGLLVLLRSSIQDRQVLLNKLNPMPDFNLQDLTQGLMLRNNLCRPAWSVCIKENNEALVYFTAQLLNQFLEKDEINFVNNLFQSLSAVSIMKKMECIVSLRKASKNYPLLLPGDKIKQLKSLIIMEYAESDYSYNDYAPQRSDVSQDDGDYDDQYYEADNSSITKNDILQGYKNYSEVAAASNSDLTTIDNKFQEINFSQEKKDEALVESTLNKKLFDIIQSHGDDLPLTRMLDMIKNKKYPDLIQNIIDKNNKGIPVWLLGVQHKREMMVQFTAVLLSQFIEANPAFAKQLLESLSEFRIYEKRTCIKILNQISESYPDLLFDDKINQLQILINQKYLESVLDQGLLSLVQSAGDEFYIDSLYTLNIELSLTIIEQLMTKDDHQIPAWLLGVRHQNEAIVQLSAILLAQFIENNKNNFAKALFDSISEFSKQDKNKCIENLYRISQKYPLYLSKYEVDKFRDVIKQEYYNKLYSEKFESWHKEKFQAITLENYVQKLIAPNANKNNLIEFSSQEEIALFKQQLYQKCKNTKPARPVFCIHSPRDLICSAAYIKHIDDHRGKILQGPGGALHDFLLQHQDPQNPPVLIINYDRFTADDIEQFKALFETHRKADGTDLGCANVIGLTNANSIHGHQEGELYKNYRVEICPFNQEQLKLECKAIVEVQEKNDTHKKTFPINFFHDNNWRTRLWGRWVKSPEEKDLYIFEKGLLEEALQSGLPIEIQNAGDLWNDPDFIDFWAQAEAEGHIEFQGRQLTYPSKKITLLKSEGYDWKSLCQNLIIEDTDTSVETKILNPGQFKDFFKRFKYNPKTKTMDLLPGYIKEKYNYFNNILHVKLTSYLDIDEWAELLTECQKYHIKLPCYIVPGVMLPPEIQEIMINTPRPAPQIEAWQENENISVTAVIESNDMEATIQLLNTKHNNFLPIYITNCTESDLMYLRNHLFNKKTLSVETTQKESVLIAALKNKTPVILYGKFPPELAGVLTAFLLERQQYKKNNPEIPVWIVTEDIKPFYALPTYCHYIDKEEKRACLLARGFSPEHINEAKLDKESLASLHARASYRAIHHDANDDRAWEGIYKLPGQLDVGEFNPDISAKEALEYPKKFKQDIDIRLKYNRHIYLVGHTGVGKTTSVEKYIPSEDSLLNQDSSKKIEFIDLKSDKRKYQFDDEVNIEGDDKTELQGLYHHRPSILSHAEIHFLDEKFAYIMAGNPHNYGDERKVPAFIKQHGNVLVIPPMSCNRIYEEMLKPVFKKTLLESKMIEISRYLLEIYQFVCGCSEDEVLMSPREVQMIALMTLSYFNRNTAADSIEVAKFYSYQIAQNLVPEKNLKEFNQKFKPEFSLLSSTHYATTTTTAAIATPTPDFIIKSHEMIEHQLIDVLNLSELRQMGDNDAQRYGGLGGIIIEHEPGVNIQNEIVIPVLKQKGYLDINGKANISRPAYFILSTMLLEEQEILLKKGFDEGAIFILPDATKSQLKEKILNSYAMGKHLDGARPKEMGSLFIFLQEPPKKSGLRIQSTALARRFINAKLPAYTSDEMEILLKKRGASPLLAKTLVMIYQDKLQQAKDQNLSPEPNWSDLVKIADEAINQEGLEQSAKVMTNKNAPVFYSPAPTITSTQDTAKEEESDEEIEDGYNNDGCVLS